MTEENKILHTVDIEKGYLILDSKKSLDLFNELVTNGSLWERLSDLFNECAKQSGDSDKYQEELTNIYEMLGKVLVSNQRMENALSQIPKGLPNEKAVNQLKPKEVEIDMVKDVTVKPMKSANKGSSIFSKFNAMKKKGE